MGTVESLGNSKNPTQSRDQAPVVAVEVGQILVPFFGERFPVVAYQIGDQLDLVRREPRQVAVHDQMIRMLVVLGVADQVADVVQDRRGVEEIAALWRQV